MWCWGSAHGLMNIRHTLYQLTHVSGTNYSTVYTCFSAAWFCDTISHCWSCPQTHQVVKNALNAWSSFPISPELGLQARDAMSSWFLRQKGSNPELPECMASAPSVEPHFEPQVWILTLIWSDLSWFPSLCPFMSSGTGFHQHGYLWGTSSFT